ncbi:MAG: FHA domain-containing protein [Bdellovibrio sp.]
MVIFIEIIEGPYEGSRFKVMDGLTIGRSKADIIVKDPKISSTHAQFMLDGKEQLILTDLNSSNGIHIGGRRVKKVSLLPGVTFEVGRTQFKVISVEDHEEMNFNRLLTWRNVLKNKFVNWEDNEKNTKSVVQSFSPALKLSFIQGIQTDEEVVLGYGPRFAGADSLDIELLDEEAPNKAFELHPGPGMIELKITAVGRVTLNNKSIVSEMLKDGDLISFGNTLIKVTYM